MTAPLSLELTSMEAVIIAKLLDAEMKRLKKRVFVQADLDLLKSLRGKMQAELDTVVWQLQTPDPLK